MYIAIVVVAPGRLDLPWRTWSIYHGITNNILGAHTVRIAHMVKGNIPEHIDMVDLSRYHQ